MIQNNYFTNNSDLLFHFQSVVDWKEIVSVYENNFSSTDETAPKSLEEALDYYRVLLESTGDITGNYISPHVAEIDKMGLQFSNGKVSFPPVMIDCVNKAKEAGLQPYAFQRKYGGLGIPFVARAILGEMLYRTDASIAIAFACVNLAEILEKNASEEMCKEWIPKFTNGEYVVAMGLTEPNHGSDLQQVKTKATKDANGQWILNGTKRFITHGCGFGDTPAIILTLARTGSESSGGRGLSFFLVEGKDVQIAGIEKKLGLHCSPTCEVVFENTPGILIGEEGQGLIKHTMGMLNGARVGVAAQGTGIATAALEEAKKFASERTQFGKTLDQIPAIKKLLSKMERETMAIRCLTYEGSRTIDMYYWRSEHLKEKGVSEKEIRNDPQIRYWEKVANVFTPISKYFCAETCNRVAYDAIQIHGGSGFTEDYDVARIYRDARITTIYDGTSQIQINAAIGGIVTGMNPNGHLRQYIQDEIMKFTPSEELKKLFSILEETVSAYKNLEMGETKDGLSLEVAETTARFLGSMLMEKSIHAPNCNPNRVKHSKEYLIDSLAIAGGNLLKIIAH